jgi:hypothetical protein
MFLAATLKCAFMEDEMKDLARLLKNSCLVSIWPHDVLLYGYVVNQSLQLPLISDLGP